jgi:putative ABC transport system permease protein
MPMLEPVEATNLFRTHRDRLLGLLRSVAALLGITWLLSMALIGLIFSIIVHNRRREIGVMRAIGATGRSIFITILAEGVFLALFGGLIGIGISLYMIHLFRGSIIQWMGIPFIFPAPAALLGLVILGLGVALITVIPAMFIPAMRIISNEPAMVMRE